MIEDPTKALRERHHSAVCSTQDGLQRLFNNGVYDEMSPVQQRVNTLTLMNDLESLVHFLIRHGVLHAEDVFEALAVGAEQMKLRVQARVRKELNDPGATL